MIVSSRAHRHAGFGFGIHRGGPPDKASGRDAWLRSALADALGKKKEQKIDPLSGTGIS
jgi:hypothetical protein